MEDGQHECYDSSLELRGAVAVSLEGSVDDASSHIYQVRHDWLIHGTIPLYVSWLSLSVSISSSVVLMEDWGLSCSPFSVSIWDRWVLW